ncbi:MAG: hypothetical protein AAF702_27595 [Chloroflexota bacterium]
MMSQRVYFEWNTLEDEFSWRRLLAKEKLEPTSTLSPASQSADRWLLLHLIRGIALLFIALIAITGTAASPTELENIRLGNEIQTVLRTEEQAKRTGDQVLLNQLIDSQSTGGWRRVWRSIPPVTEQDAQQGPVMTLVQAKSMDNLVMAEVLVEQPAYGWSQFSPYKELRFYRKTNSGWLRTVPDDTFWGGHHVVESDLLRFEFRNRDAQLVQANVEHLDQIYASLHQMLGLELASTSEKHTFVLTPEMVNETGNLTTRNAIVSPLLSQMPQNTSIEAYFLQTVVTRMTYLTVNRRISEGYSLNQRGGSSYRWRNMQIGLRRWLRIELLSVVPPWDQMAVKAFEAQLAVHLPMTLRDVSEEDLDLLTDRDYRYWHSGAAISLIDYMVDTYSEEVLPRLVRGLQSDKRWQELIPYITGRSVTEFETEWNQYLAQKVP